MNDFNPKWWAKLFKFLGPRVSAATCPHPRDKWEWDDGCAFDPAGDVKCRDCGTCLFIGLGAGGGVVTDAGRIAGMYLR